MNTKEYLYKNDIPYFPSGNNLVIGCPFCDIPVATGEQLATFHINQADGHGICSNCKTTAEFSEVTAKLGSRSNEVIKSDNRVLATNSAVVSSSPSAQIVAIGDILAREYGNEEWTIDRILPVSGILALSGIPGSFKTWITHSIALSVARGIPVFGEFAVKQGAVLFIDEENHERLIKQRFLSLGALASDPIHFLSLTGFKVDKEGSVEALIPKAKQLGVTLVIIDSLIRIHSRDENAAADMARVFGHLKMFTREGIAVLFTHHHRKGQAFGRSNPVDNLRGSSDILAAVDSHVSVEQNQQSEGVLVLRMSKSRYAAPVPSFEVKIVKTEQGIAGFEYMGTHDERATKASEAAEAIIEFLIAEGVKSRQEIHEVLGQQFGKTAIDDGIKNIETAKRVERVPKDALTPEQAKFGRRAYYRAVSDSENETDHPATS